VLDPADPWAPGTGSQDPWQQARSAPPRWLSSPRRRPYLSPAEVPTLHSRPV
jgi:hypothetical protein